LAIDQGVAAAQNNLGVMYFNHTVRGSAGEHLPPRPRPQCRAGAMTHEQIAAGVRGINYGER
jgi:hypothetical protein